MWNSQGGFQGYGGDHGGGGYMSPGAGGFGTPQPDEKRARSRVQSIMPCTVAQILSATQTEDKFFSGPNEISQGGCKVIQKWENSFDNLWELAAQCSSGSALLCSSPSITVGVTLVGVVRSVNQTTTRLDYEVDDMTGPPLEVKQFVDNDVARFHIVSTKIAIETESVIIPEMEKEVLKGPYKIKKYHRDILLASEIKNNGLWFTGAAWNEHWNKRHWDQDSVPADEKVQAMRENTYVRVCGHVRAFGGKRNVVAFKIAPVTDMNELTCHILEVIHSSLALSKMHNQPDGGMAHVNGGKKMETGYADTNTNGGGMFNGLSQIQSQVHMAIRNTLADQGISVENVCKQIRGVPEKAVRDAIEFLSSEGHIYSTIDDEHYKATDS